MSVRYAAPCLLWEGNVVPGTAQADFRFGLPNGGLILGITAYVETQGTNAAHAIAVTTDAATPVSVVSLTIGTNAAKSCLQAKTSDANTARDASTTAGYIISSSGADSTADYHAQVWGTCPLQG